MPRDDILQFFGEEEAYLPDGHFSSDASMASLEGIINRALTDGYDHVWMLGDASWVVRDKVDTKAWFSLESQMNDLTPRYPQFVMCLYDLDLFDGDRVLAVLQTHARIFLNGMIIKNPYFVPARDFLGTM